MDYRYQAHPITDIRNFAATSFHNNDISRRKPHTTPGATYSTSESYRLRVRHRCGLCTTAKDMTRSSLEPQQQLPELQTCFSRCDGPRLHYDSVPPPPRCCWFPYCKLWYSRTPGVLLLLLLLCSECCSGTGTCVVDRHAFTRGDNLGVS